MKYLFLLLLFLAIFWYYKKKKVSLKKEKKGALSVEMKACEHCGVFVPESEAYTLKGDSKERFFCSEKCLKEHLAKEEV